SQMSTAETRMLVPEAGKSGTGDCRPAISGSGSKFERLSMFNLPVKTIATAYLLIMFVSCGLAFLLVLEAIEGVEHPLAPFVAFLCILPVPFLIFGFVAIRKEHHGMATVFEGYMILLAMITLVFWSMILVHSFQYYLTWHQFRREPIQNPFLGLSIILFTLHACYVFYKFQNSLSVRNHRALATK
ncbi:hypothetical protein PMAYCL1PPCAC_03772, partial [Pristionchus mayeri]